MFTIYLVDHDPEVLKRLSRLFQGNGYSVRTCNSLRELLRSNAASIPGCAVIEISTSTPDVSKLQRVMRKIERPVIYLTESGDIHLCVRAMKAGAIDFLQQPVREEELLAAIEVARKRDSKARRISADITSIKTKIASLTPREHEVMTHVIAGTINRETAKALGTAEKTIKVHRGRVMKKLKVRSVADLVRLAAKAEIS